MSVPAVTVSTQAFLTQVTNTVGTEPSLKLTIDKLNGDLSTANDTIATLTLQLGDTKSQLDVAKSDLANSGADVSALELLINTLVGYFTVATAAAALTADAVAVNTAAAADLPAAVVANPTPVDAVAVDSSGNVVDPPAPVDPAPAV